MSSDVNTDTLASLPTKLEGGNPIMVQGPSVAHSPMYTWSLQGMKHYHSENFKVFDCAPLKPRTIIQGEQILSKYRHFVQHGSYWIGRFSDI
jgi:hypothetical protein